MIGDAIAETDRKVLLLASGALSHTFWKLRQLRDHEAAGVEHIRTPEAYAADRDRIAWFKEGDHAGCSTPCRSSCRYRPEAMFAHYLMMAGALGRAGQHRHRPAVRRLRELHRHRSGPPVVRPA